MSLVVFTAFVGLVAAPGRPSIRFIAVIADPGDRRRRRRLGRAQHVVRRRYRRGDDAHRQRGRSRRAASSRDEALAFGLVLSVLSVMTLGVLVNWLAAALLAFTIFFYAVIYTMWLKRSDAAEHRHRRRGRRLPPMIGWAAATGSVSLESVVLFLIIFLWTPPHFWALALFKADEYGRAGIPMMPNVAGARLDAPADLRLCAGRRCRSACCRPCSAMPASSTASSPSALGAGFVWYAWKVLQHGRRRPRHEAGQGAVRLFAALSLRDLRGLSGRRGRRSACLLCREHEA